MGALSGYDIDLEHHGCSTDHPETHRLRVLG